jgi:tRNA(fMet)-specific endonuclease VapC
MARYVFDTNIFTAILRQEPRIAQRLAEDPDGDQFLLCPVVFYEVQRGLLHRDAKRQLAFFMSYAARFIWDDFNQTDWQQAAHLWADLRRQGRFVEDSDLLIGVYATERQAIVVTDNEKDFAPLGIAIENWRR